MGEQLLRGPKLPPKKIETLVTQIVEPIVKEIGLELVEVGYLKEGNNWFLRLFVDHPEGIDLEICQVLSRKVGSLLDEADFISQAYFLEVSSPGLERPLKKEEDFWRYQGKKIRVTTYAPVAGQKTLEGVLKGLIDGQVIINQNSENVTIPFNQVASARLMVEF